ncbi:unnamed protein product [Amoebophrya sp. A25]|nr:unnamed protein product [Amoebophrya sp. A25]|eukprot:GSA25T00024532001.1
MKGRKMRRKSSSSKKVICWSFAGALVPHLSGTTTAVSALAVQRHGLISRADAIESPLGSDDPTRNELKQNRPWSAPNALSEDYYRRKYLPPEHTLRVCNAYPYTKPMNLYLNDVDLFGGLEYKDCVDFVDLKLLPGDNIRFKTEVDHHERGAGIFEIADIPDDEATTLLLVVTRHGRSSNAVAFQSHVFKASKDAQVAVLDTFQGLSPSGEAGRVEIMHEGASKTPHGRPETLPFGRVNRINAGVYDLILDDRLMGTADNAVREFIALPGHDYVVLRVGIEDEPEANDGPQEGVSELGDKNPVPGDASFPEELVLFPLSDPTRLVGYRRGGMPDSIFWFLLCAFCFLVVYVGYTHGGKMTTAAGGAAGRVFTPRGSAAVEGTATA